MQLPEPTYHGTIETWLLLGRLLWKAYWFFFVSFGVIAGWESYLRHEVKIKGFIFYAARALDAALGWVPYPEISALSVAKVREQKRKVA